MNDYQNVVVKNGKIEGEQRLASSDSNWYKFSADVSLFRIKEAIIRYKEALRRIWLIQDGYGIPGFTPVQGFDWSGIRDSSNKTIEKMEEIAKEYVSDEDLERILGTKLN
jgi:hypothetical protein